MSLAAVAITKPRWLTTGQQASKKHHIESFSEEAGRAIEDNLAAIVMRKPDHRLSLRSEIAAATPRLPSS
jgi:hypothetical protein